MKVTLIHNPHAGRDGNLSGDEIVRLITDAGHSATYQSSIGDTWHKVLEKSAEIVAVAGGDGIVGKVAKRLVGGGVPIAVLPMGTANNVARALGLINYSPEQLIAGWPGARRMKFDAGAASGPWGSTYFIEGLGMGLFTDTMSRLDARKNIDLAHHSAAEKKIMSVVEFMNVRLEGCPVYRLAVALDDRDLSGEYVLAEAMNISSIGPNLCLAPAADPGDGMLDVVLVADHERSRMRSFLSDHLEEKPGRTVLTVHKGRHLHIECDWCPIHIDDDIKSKKKGATPLASSIIDVTLEPAALEMLVPA
jgi:diacylglycerol kinase family enzyme